MILRGQMSNFVTGQQDNTIFFAQNNLATSTPKGNRRYRLYYITLSLSIFIDQCSRCPSSFSNFQSCIEIWYVYNTEYLKLTS